MAEESSSDAESKRRERLARMASEAGICSMDAEHGYDMEGAREALPFIKKILEEAEEIHARTEGSLDR